MPLTPERFRLKEFEKKMIDIPLRIKGEQPFFDKVDRQRFANCETAKSSPGVRHNRSPSLEKNKIDDYSISEL
jgi:hypothetical protein